MRDYEVCLQEHDEWCIPASLQTVLRSRRIEISQKKIAVNFPDFFEDSIFRGFEFSEELFQKFLRRGKFKLKCRFLNPFLDFEIYQGVDVFLNGIKDDETIDVLVAYNSKFHQEGTRRKRIDHLAVLLNYSFNSDEVRVTGIEREPYKDIPLQLLVENLHPDKNKNYGFYVIENEP